MEFVARNFTPEPQNASDFLVTLQKVRVTEADSIDYAEDVFSGVKRAILETQWTQGAARLLLLVGDAPAHELGHQWNGAGMDEHELRLIANEHKINIAALHLIDPDFPEEQPIAERQFSVLAQNPNSANGRPAYFPVQAYQSAGYQAAAESFLFPLLDAVVAATNQIGNSVATAKNGPPHYSDLGAFPLVDSTKQPNSLQMIGVTDASIETASGY